MSHAPSRTAYAACPLCNGQQFQPVGTYDCSRHALFRPPLPPTMTWLRCQECSHVFTDGYFNAAAMETLFGRTHPEQTPGHEPGQGRAASAPIVETITRILGGGVPSGRWLDVGFGAGALLTTAEEYGYEASGLDLRRTSVAILRELGYDVHCADIATYSPRAPLDVISMADVLEHMPFPGKALDRAYTTLRLGGLIFLSMPNMECFQWRVMDRRKQNPYWGELEHYHNFGRKRLYALLQEHGFTPCHYGISSRYLAGMEVVARKGGGR